MKQRRIIDKREKAKFMIDDVFLERMAKLCGWHGVLVYMSLCRHANKDQECFPSIRLMATQHNVSRSTILKGIGALEVRQVIHVSKARSKGGKWLNNTYILLDKAEWDYSQVDNIDLDSQNELVTMSTTGTLPSSLDTPSQVHENDIKETHVKETHKEGNTLFVKQGVLPGKDIFQLVEELPLVKEKKNGQEIESEVVEPKEGLKINEAIALFQKILPGDFVGSKTAFSKPPTREAVSILLNRYTIEDLQILLNKYDGGITDPFRPSAGTVYEFCTSKLGKIEAFVSKSAGGLHAQKTVSTPEQAKVRDAQYQKIFDATKEKTRKAKEEWNKLHSKQNQYGNCIDKECKNHDRRY